MPLRETAYQGYTFLALIYAGMAAGLLYDLASPALNSRRWPLRLAAEIALCAAVATLCLAALLYTGCGSLRPYMLLALAAGAAVYRLGVRRVFIFLINALRKNRSSRKRSE